MSDNKQWNEGSLPEEELWVEYDLKDLGIGGQPEETQPQQNHADSASAPETSDQSGAQRRAAAPENDDVEEPTRRLTKANRPGRGELVMRASQLDDEADDELENRDYRPIRFRRDGRLGCLGGMMYAVFIISVSVILACVGWMAASDVLALNKEPLVAMVELPRHIFSDKEVTVKSDDEHAPNKVEIMPSADMDYVAAALKDAGIIEYPFLFKLYARFANADLKVDPGTYALSTSFDYRALIKKMQTGSESQLQTLITFPEGYTMRQIFAKLEEENICSQEKLYEAAESYRFSYSFLDSTTAVGYERLEGYLFPDSYYFYEGMSASSAISKLLSNMHYLITADMLASAENLGLTWNEVIVIASLIEKETAGSAEDRANISCVIHNRLKADMPLQIDASVLYDHPDHQGAPTGAMLETDSPHNTHTRLGLPETAISNPGLASIQAALKPSSQQYYYYALDEATGEHRFFTNYYDHQAFVATQSYAQ